MTYKVYNTGTLETVDQKPNIETVLWFSINGKDEIIPHIGAEARVTKARKGVLSTKFRQTQHNLFKKYYNLNDGDDVPYKHAYVKNDTGA